MQNLKKVLKILAIVMVKLYLYIDLKHIFKINLPVTKHCPKYLIDFLYLDELLK